jgi:hypothetical protein
MTRWLALAAVLLAAPATLYGCAPPVVQQAGTSCEQLGLQVRVLDGQLAQERIVIGAATRQHDLQPGGNLHLTDDHPGDPRGDRALRDRQAHDLEQMRNRLAVHEAALAEARTRGADCAR